MTDEAAGTQSGIGGRAAVLAYLGVSGIVLLLMMLLGLVMRMARHGGSTSIPASFT